jgi:arylsulfatase A-like enzyme
MKPYTTLIAVSSFLFFPSFAFSLVPETIKDNNPPNIILILFDDLGYGDLGCYGNQLNRTPNIDKMAKDGLLLKDFCVASSVSTPSRAALLTGCYPKRISMHVNADPVPIWDKGRQVLFPASWKGLNPNEITIAEMLKTHSYSTACVGKWHLGDQLPFLPTEQGFDYYYGIPYSHDMDRKICPLPLMEQKKVIESPVSIDSLTYKYTIRAKEYIRSNKNKSFFLYLSHNMTHVPLSASKNFRGKSKNGIYGDAIEELDWSVGEILKTLKEENLEENTLIILTSDNGAAVGCNAPLRGKKATIYEGGFRVPCIIKWPNVIQKNRVSNSLITSMDILPTIAYYCNIKLPVDRIIDGKNVSSILSGIDDKSPTEVFYYYQKNQLQAVRWKNWKYYLPLDKKIMHPAMDIIESSKAYLYDLDNDVTESKNLLSEYPNVVKKMESLIIEVRNDMGDWNCEGNNIRPAGYIDEPFYRILK